MNKESLKSYLSSRYQGWNSFLNNVIFPIFGEEDFEDGYETELLESQPERKQLAEATGIRSIKQVGKIYVGVEPLQIFDVTVSNRVMMERNRVNIQRLIRAVMDQYSCAFMLFHYEDDTRWDWRFTFCRKSGNKQESTDSKRYTFLLGPGQSCRTATDNFMALYEKRQSIEIRDIEDAFSVEALTKQFYNDLFNWYTWAVAPASNVTFPGDTTTPDDDREDLETKIIRMITRIMFVWFIKQKELVPDKIFDAEFLQTILKDFDPQSTTVGNYYNAILQNLFFATLNRAIVDEDGERRGFAHNVSRDVKNKYRYEELFSISEDEVVDLFATVPFVNGGLFECLDKTKSIDGVDQAFNYDGFSRNDRTFANGRYKHRAIVPNVLFFEPEKGLFSILKRYNFTIEENSPEDQQVALDPELLGKVFENLLGAYNPETQESARNSSGSFYTPREIVNYMIDESLVQYLGDNPTVRSLFAEDFTPDESLRETYDDIARRLKAVKILDPACGSGAFPMGALKRIVEVLKRINPNESDYDLKLSIIENCIYGSDIQCIATQISKLRFFISLICECDRDESKPNFGIPVLPNLETKFVAANSLLSKKKRDNEGNLFEDPEIEVTKNALAQVRHEHFSATTTNRKRVLRKRDEELRTKLARLLDENHEFAAPQDAIQLAGWNPYDQNAVADFFDPEWMFGIATGFDIVIGNPPYIQLQKDGGRYAQLYQNCGYKTFARTGDMYCLFYERGWQLLKKGGHLCYITSNKWMRANYGEKTREFFAANTDPMLLIDFAGVKIFESATVDTNILLFAKGENQHKTICAVTNKQNKDRVKNLSVFVQQQHSICDFNNSDSWVILSEIEQSIKRKIEAVGTPLKDWDIQINYGIKTGYNDAFIISTEKRDEILANCATDDERNRTAELIRPILRGRDIKRYGYEWAGLWLINTHNGVKGVMPRIDINDYPAVKQHLDKYWDKISKRADKGDTPYNLRNCAYVDDFNQPKITWGNLNLKGAYSYAPEGMFINAPSPFIATSQIAILHILNSKIADYYIRSLGVTRNGGFFEYKPMFVDKLPVPTSGLDVLNTFPAQPTAEQDVEIENRIFNIYGISDVEAEFLKSRQF